MVAIVVVGDINVLVIELVLWFPGHLVLLLQPPAGICKPGAYLPDTEIDSSKKYKYKKYKEIQRLIRARNTNNSIFIDINSSVYDISPKGLCILWILDVTVVCFSSREIIKLHSGVGNLLGKQASADDIMMTNERS